MKKGPLVENKFLGDEILASYVGIIFSTIIRIQFLNNQYNCITITIFSRRYIFMVGFP